MTNLRQLGDQEVDIIRMVKGITKYAVWVNEPETIAYHLERAWYLARTGGPDPAGWTFRWTCRRRKSTRRS